MSNGEDQGGTQPPEGGYPPQGGGYPPPQYPPPQYPPPQTYPPPQGGQPPPQYPPPQGYPPPQYPPGGYYAPAPSKPNNTLAIVSLISGIAGLTVLPFLASIVGVICGHIAKKQISESQGREGGEGLATAGIVTGYIGIVVWGLIIVLGVLLAGWFIENADDIIREIEKFSPSPDITF